MPTLPFQLIWLEIFAGGFLFLFFNTRLKRVWGKTLRRWPYSLVEGWSQDFLYLGSPFSWGVMNEWWAGRNCWMPVVPKGCPFPRRWGTSSRDPLHYPPRVHCTSQPWGLFPVSWLLEPPEAGKSFLRSTSTGSTPSHLEGNENPLFSKQRIKTIKTTADTRRNISPIDLQEHILMQIATPKHNACQWN